MLVLFMMVLYISEVQVTSCSQEGSTCSSQRCNCEVNNGVVLQTLIESMVNQSLNKRLPASVEEAVEGKFQAVQRKINDTIDEKFVDIQQDIPGKEYYAQHTEEAVMTISQYDNVHLHVYANKMQGIRTRKFAF